MFAKLAEKWRYQRALERLTQRASRRGRPRLICEGGPDLRELHHQLDGVANKLARAVSQGRYRFSPVEPRTVIVDKPRVLYAMTAADHAVLLVLSQLLTEAIEPILPEALHSYRRGRGAHTALESLASYLAEYRRATPIRARALYLLRRDVRAYGDSIPAGDDSPLWPELALSLGPQPADFLRFVQSAFCPPVRWPDGRVAPREVGIVNGNPCQTIACNLYLRPLDDALARLPGGLYLRYGDDLLFAHPDAVVARKASELLDAQARALRLDWGVDKSRALYFTGPGRRPSTECADFVASDRTEYLGLSVSFNGARSLKKARARKLLRRLRMRLHHALGSVDAVEGESERATVAAQVVRCALDPRSPVRDPLAELLAGPVNDRGQLRKLDHEIALLAAERACRKRGVRAFRTLPPRELYARGLPSLLAQRNSRRAHGP